MLPPLRFQGIPLEKVWGGSRLREQFGKDVPAGKKIGELWEISDREGAETIVAEGPLKGRTLRQIMRERKADLLGRIPGSSFPLLVKWIDVEAPLSIQVHPDLEFLATRPDAGEPKTELWVFAQADERAAIIGGVKGGWPPDKQALAGEGFADLFERFSVRPGDFAAIEAGTAHALLPGMLLLEIQENSDTTYRLHDWGRDAAGTGRPLHPELAIPAVRPALRAIPASLQSRLGPGFPGGPEKTCVLRAGVPFESIALESARPFVLPAAPELPSVFCVLEGKGQLRFPDGSFPLRPGAWYRYRRGDGFL
ncbi:MAG: type I phosphomannose isomerase catalytic subunit, partial [Planctomycetota bacterium]